VAHEMAHFTAGDTRLTRRAFRHGLMMDVLEEEFRQRPLSLLNPLVWLLPLYHLALPLALAAHSGRQEFAADRYAVRQAGKEAAAVALVYFEVTHRLPWARLENILKSCVANNLPMEAVFAEQVRLARSTQPYEWEEACRKVLRV